MAFPKGSQVKQVLAAPIQGSIDSFSVDQESGQIQYLVKWLDGGGVEHSRFFKDGEVELVEQT